MTKLLIDGATFDVPDEEDWTLLELAEFQRLRDKWGDIGSTIALVWITKRRDDPTFTLELAEQVRVGQIDEVEEKEVPLAPSDGSSASALTSSDPSVNPDDSGQPLLAGSTA